MLRIALLRSRRGWRLALCTLGFVLHQLGEAAVPIIIGIVIDEAVVQQDPQALFLWLGALAAVFVVLSISYQRASLGMVRVYGHGEHDLRQLAVARVLDPRGMGRHRHPGEVLSITTSDTYRVAGVAWSIAEQGSTVAALLAASTALLLISVPLGIGVLVGAVAVLVGMQRLAKPLERLGMQEQTSVAGASQVATDTLLGLRIVRGLGAEDEMVRRYRAASASSLQGAVRTGQRLITYEAFSNAVSVCYLAILALAAAWLAARGDITVGQLVTVVALAQFLQGALAHIGTFGANWSHKRASARRLHSLIAEPFKLPSGTVSITATDTPLSWLRGTSQIEFSPGRTTGIRISGSADAQQVWRTLGLSAKPNQGELLLHGEDAVRTGPATYRQIVSAPPHDALLLDASVRDNVVGPLALSREVAWRTEVVAATALDDVLAQLGSQEQQIGEGGRRLSGGQRQRVRLARALHDDSEVVVLCEPTTALDPLTERRVAQGIAQLERTIVLITSSPVLLEICDRIVDGAELLLNSSERSSRGLLT